MSNTYNKHEEELLEIIPKILISVRTEKGIDYDVLEALFEVLSQLSKSKEAVISKNIVYHLVYLSRFIRQQSRYTDHPDSLLQYVEEIENWTLKICEV